MYSNAKRPIFTLTILAAATVLACRAIGADGHYAGAGLHMSGVADVDAEATDELAIDVLGTSTLEAGAAIAADALVEVGANGKFVTKVGGKAVARAIGAAAGDGSKFEALLLPAST